MKKTTLVFLMWVFFLVLTIFKVYPFPKWFLFAVFFFWIFISYWVVHQENKRSRIPRPVYLAEAPL